MNGIKQGYYAGMRGFSLLWLGQMVSLLGTAMTTFGLTIWAYEVTGRATELALVGTFNVLPEVIFAPLSGMIVDRFDRRLLMIVADLAAGLGTVIVFVLYAAGQLAIWHLYVAAFVQGMAFTVQWPATSAAIAVMIPKKHYARAHGMLMMAGPFSRIVAPMLAGALLGVIGLRGILTIDIITFLFAVGAMLFVMVPAPPPSAAAAGGGSLWRELSFGFRYIFSRPPLLALQTTFLLGNFLIGFSMLLVPPMILARTGNDELMLGAVQTVGAFGSLLGAVVISAWGGFKRRVHGVLIGWAGVLGWTFVVSLGRPDPAWAGLPVWGIGIFLSAVCIPLLDSANQAIWQSKVPPDVQGRVFAIRAMIAVGVMPITGVIAGPLADGVFEPGMQPGGALADAFGPLLGTGPGAGMALLIGGVGLFGMVLMLSAYLVPRIRQVESLLPDHDAVSGPAVAAQD